MDLKDSTKLRHLGIVLLDNLAFFSTITLLYGVFILLFSIAAYTTIRRGFTSRATQAMFLLIVINFLLNTIYWADWMSVVAILIRTALVKDVGMSLDEKFALTNLAMNKPTLVIVFAAYFQPILTDIAVVWRAWVLFPEKQWVMVGPLFALLATVAIIVTNLVVTMLDVTGSLNAGKGSLVSKLDVSIIALSMATNLLATLLITYKLWDHRKFIGNLGLQKRRSPVQNILIVLVESGVIYCGLQLASLLLSLLPVAQDSASDYASQVCHAFYTQLSAMYPALIVVIVNQHRSIVDTYSFSTTVRNNIAGGHANDVEDRPATAGHLAFASPPSDSKTESL